MPSTAPSKDSNKRKLNNKKTHYFMEICTLIDDMTLLFFRLFSFLFKG